MSVGGREGELPELERREKREERQSALPLPLTHSHTLIHPVSGRVEQQLRGAEWKVFQHGGKYRQREAHRSGVGLLHQHHTLLSSLHTHAQARVNPGCQAGRDGEDAHLTHSHTCSHTHGDTHSGAYHGGPGSGDTWEDPPADAKAAGGDSAEEQRREGKT